MNKPERITLAHGNGGRHMRELVENLFAVKLANPLLDTRVDACHLQLESPDICFTTDGFTVTPLEFPGGSIGSLAIHGTVNDLAVSGATPKYLSLNAFIEEGLAFDQLERILDDMARAAQACHIQIVTGDTKVLPMHQANGIYFATTGIGIYNPAFNLGMDRIQPGDKILVNGSIGDHGTAVMLAREQYGLSGQLKSDSASVLPFTQALSQLSGLRFMRDPTRGGLATVGVEIARQARLGCYLYSTQIPIKPQVESVCEMLGYDPYYLACEGRVVAIVDSQQAPQALAFWQQLPGGEGASIIGEIIEKPVVILETELGGQRVLDELEDDPLPRIC